MSRIELSVEPGTKTFAVLAFVDDYKTRYPYSPDYREIGSALDITSTSVCNYYLTVLENNKLVSFLYTKRKYRAPRTVHLTPKGRKLLKDYTVSTKKEAIPVKITA